MKLYNEDCLIVLKEIPDESIDCVVTDCPYHIVSGGCSTGTYGNDKEPGGMLKRDFIGIEIDEKYFNIAKERIENVEKLKNSQMTIFDFIEE